MRRFKPLFFHTATFRLTGLYLLLFVTSAGILVALLFFQVRQALESEARNQISHELNLLLFEYKEDGLDELLEETEERIEKNDGQDRLLYMVQNPAGRVIFDRIEKIDPPLGWRAITGKNSALFFFEELDNGYILGVGKDMSALTAAERAMGRTLLWAMLAVLILGGVGGFFLSRRTLAQVESINRTAQIIGAGSLAQRIPLRNTGDELDDLGRTLNQMFDRIETLVANVRQVSTGIAHDLRTPLARLRTRLESLQTGEGHIAEEAFTEAVAEVDNILQTFAALLRLAELETGTLKAGFKAVDLTALVKQILDVYTPIVEDAGKHLGTGELVAATVVGDKNLLQQMLVNLLENALQHAGDNCEIRVSIKHENREVLLQVADNGVGIPAAERERVIKPFQRLDENSGTGLGLSLVHATALLHGGGLSLLDNHPGLLCQVSFPAPDGNKK